MTLMGWRGRIAGAALAVVSVGAIGGGAAPARTSGPQPEATRAVGGSPRALTARVLLRAPAGLRATSTDAARITLAWRNRARGATRTRITWRAAGSRRWQGRSVRATTRQATLTRLRPNTRYLVAIKACRGARCGASDREWARTSATGPPGTPGGTSTVGGCTVFPDDNAWNRRVDTVPAHPNSAALIRSIGAERTLHADFGSGRYGDYGIPVTVVPADQKPVPITFTAYGDESDPGPYPIPPDARVEGARDGADGDRHVIVVQRGACKLYELYRAQRRASGWAADSGAVFDLSSNNLRPAGWTSADAAGLPILPGLARADEASAGVIAHALRFTVRKTRRAYIAPARHFASSDTDPDLPPMGLRVRLKRSFSLAGYTGQARAILVALRDYGMIVADNGSDWFISGTPDPAWDDDDLDQLKRVPGSAFEALDTGPAVTG